jgi:drug/metabolite transporter (DMT)-like permease
VTRPRDRAVAPDPAGSGAVPAAVRPWATAAELALLGAIWGASFLFMRIAADDFGAATLVWASILPLPVAVWQWPATPVPTGSWLAALALGVLCTGTAYAFYFRLLQRIGATRASTVTYLVPLFAIAWAWLLLGEPPTLEMAIAATLILGSVALSQRAR